MELGDSIVLAAIIITLGAVTIAVTLIIRKKTVVITLFSIFTVLIALLIVFKNDLLKFTSNIFEQKDSHQSQAIPHRQDAKYLNLSYKSIDLNKSHLSDILFLFGKPDVITPDSTILVYGNWDTKYRPPINFRLNWEQTEIQQNKNKSRFLINSNTLREAHFIDSLSYFPYGHFIITTSASQTTFIGEMDCRGNDLGKSFYDYNLKSLVDNFGVVSNTWISEGDQVRIYQIRANFFFLKDNKCCAWGIASSEIFDPTQLRPITQSLKFRKLGQ